MFRASARRLGGRVGKSGGSLLRRRNHASGAADGALAALSAASPTAGALSAAPLLPHNASLRTVLPRVDCGPLKALVAAASMRNLSPTDVPDVAHVLRLDYTQPVAQGGKHAAHLDHPLADIVLVNRLHAVVADYARLHADQEGDGGAESSKRGKGSASSSSSAPPLLVLVETSLAPEEAEVQQFVLRSALSLHPLPEKVEMRDEKGETPRWVPTPPLTVMILSAEMTARVRASSAISSATSPSAAGPTEAAATAEAKSAKRGKQRTPSPARSAPESLLDAALKPQAQAAKKVQQHKPGQALTMTAKASKKAGVDRAATKLETSTTKRASLRSKKADGGRAGRARQGSGRRHSRPAPSSSSSSPATPAHLAPRLLTTDDATERVLWASAPGHPLPVHLLAPLVRPAVLARLCDAAAAAVGRGAATATQAGADGAAGGTEVARLHTVVYRAGAQSSAETIWTGALHASATLAASVSGGRSALAVHLESGAAAPRKKEKTQQQQPTRNGEAPWVYLLIHTSLSLQDAAVLQQELDFRLGQLRSSPAGAEVAGISVLSAADVSPSQLCYVLQSGVEAGSGRAAFAESAMTTTTSAAATQQHPHVYAERAAPPATAEAVEMAQTFQEVYRLLLSQCASPQHGLLAAAPDTRSSLPSSSSSAAAAAAGAHPDAFVSEAIRVAALTHVLVQRREAQVRHELDVAQQRSAVSTDSEAVARAAQKVEMKTMVTEAVEEVSVRHEQATAHLVKTLSSMAGQWSLEKLSDTLEAIIRDEVKPIMDVLEERLSNAAAVGEGGQAEPKRGSADAAGDAEAPVYAASPSSPAVMDASSGEALLEGQRAMQSTLHEVLEELRGLMARAADALSAAPRVESGDGHGDGSTDASPQQQEQHQQPLDETRIVEALRDSQQQQHEELRHTLQAFKDDLQASIAEASPPAYSSTASATAGAAAPAGLTQEAAEAVAAQATGRVVEVLRESIRASVSEQLDSYCEMHRSSRSDSSSSSSDRVSLPFLPVTSFELEEMLMRTVNFAVQDSVSAIEAHVRTAMSSALAEHANASSTAAPAVGGAGDATTAGSDSADGRSDSSSSHTAMKAALEELWAQVKAEAAEEEAVKLSTHNRQLLRLFRRQQHLQRTGGTSATATAAESAAVGGEGAVTRLAIEEAVRAAMHPYMAQMQATLVAVRAAPKDKKE